MTYKISERFSNTIQGEGVHAGCPTSFIRLSNCNLWTNEHKPSATCPFCDTPQLFNVEELTFDQIQRWALEQDPMHGLVISGGEPLLQLDQPLIDMFSKQFLWIDVETNGSVPMLFHKPDNVFISCSPKNGRIIVQHVDWFKVLCPDKMKLIPKVEEYRKSSPKSIVYLQPVEVDGYESETTKKNIEAAVQSSLFYNYRVCLQLHKILGVR